MVFRLSVQNGSLQQKCLLCDQRTVAFSNAFVGKENFRRIAHAVYVIASYSRTHPVRAHSVRPHTIRSHSVWSHSVWSHPNCDQPSLDRAMQERCEAALGIHTARRTARQKRVSL